jgi:hypothetical protein
MSIFYLLPQHTSTGHISGFQYFSYTSLDKKHLLSILPVKAIPCAQLFIPETPVIVVSDLDSVTAARF